MLCGPVAVAVSESRFARNFSTFSGAKDAESRSNWVQLGRVGTEREELGTIFGSKHTIEAFRLLTSSVEENFFVLTASHAES